MDYLNSNFKYKKRWKTKIIISDNLTQSLLPLLKTTNKIFIISDSKVASLYGKKISSICSSLDKRSELLIFPEGEKSKTTSTSNEILVQLINKDFKKGDTILALGGGVTTDLVGFTAAILHRGTDFISIPTTILGAVDASIGGKTGVNLPQGKNLVGVYHFPTAVVVYPPFFKTLNEKEIKNGWAEIIKSAIIGSRSLFTEIQNIENLQIFKEYDDSIISIIKKTMEIKLGIVKKDPMEISHRFILNFGHTVGHAIESASDFTISHGEAVAKGIAIEIQLAEHIMDFPKSEVKKVIDLLIKVGFDLHIPFKFDQLQPWLKRDKKNSTSLLTASLPNKIGAKLNKTDQLPSSFKSEVLKRFLP
jgi:3-dehydroquinate synthase